MKMEIKDSIMLTIFLLIMCLASSIVGYFYNDIREYNISNEPINVSDYEQCRNLSLEKTSECLINYVRPFYNFTVRDDITRDIQDIKANGGDCYDYSRLYNTMAKNLGFESEVVIMDTGENKAHAIEIISSEEGYCVIDQLNKYCQMLG